MSNITVGNEKTILFYSDEEVNTKDRKSLETIKREVTYV